jgi:hypothetical protein
MALRNRLSQIHPSRIFPARDAHAVPGHTAFTAVDRRRVMADHPGEFGKSIEARSRRQQGKTWPCGEGDRPKRVL